MTPVLIYGVCTLTALMCAWLLLSAYQRTRYRLLLWTGLFFSITAANNAFLMIDKMMPSPSVNLSAYHYGIVLVGLGVLLPGLIFERE